MKSADLTTEDTEDAEERRRELEGEQQPMMRPIGRYLAWTGITIIVGLASRKFAPYLPGPLRKYPGDVLWGLMVYWLWCLALRRAAIGKVAVAAIVFSIGIEFFKFVHTPWLDTFRTTWQGRLLLGVGFRWANLACYIAGIAAGVAWELRMQNCDRTNAGSRE